MKKKIPYVKLTLDILMGITFALLYNKNVLGGLAFHEIAGAAIGAAFITHILLNFKFVQKVTVRLFDKALPARTRFSYLLSFLLLLSMGLVIFSGLVISRVLLPNFQLGNENWFKMAHMGSAYLGLALIGVHIGLHWHWVIKMFQKILHLKVSKRLSRVLMTGAAVIVLGFGVYQFYTTSYWSKLQMVQSMFTSTAGASGKGGFEHGGGFDRGGAAPTDTGSASADTGSSSTADTAGASGTTAAAAQANGASADSSGTVQAASGDQSSSFKDGDSFDSDEGGMRGQFGGEGVKGRESGSSSWYQVLLTYFGIMAVFAGITYYLDKWITSRKKRVRKTVQQSA